MKKAPDKALNCPMDSYENIPNYFAKTLYTPVFFCYRTSVDKPQHLSAERRKLP